MLLLLSSLQNSSFSADFGVTSSVNSLAHAACCCLSYPTGLRWGWWGPLDTSRKRLGFKSHSPCDFRWLFCLFMPQFPHLTKGGCHPWDLSSLTLSHLCKPFDTGSFVQLCLAAHRICMIIGAKSLSDQNPEHMWGHIKVKQCHVTGHPKEASWRAKFGVFSSQRNLLKNFLKRFSSILKSYNDFI